MGKVKDLTGQIFGNWKVLKRGESRLYTDGCKRTTWTCQCLKNPEYITDKVGVSLQKLTKPTCMGCVGCKDRDLTGRVFGRLTVLHVGMPVEDSSGRRYKTWTCECSCEKHTIKDIKEKELLYGSVKSCGCLKREVVKTVNKTHGKCYTPLYHIWMSMKARCYRESDCGYTNYGARGITICDEWKNDFLAFEEWSLQHGYKQGLSIDRIDNNGRYAPDNCRWVSSEVQANNKRNTRYLTVDGVTKPIAVWAKERNIPVERIRDRILKLGWSDKDAISKPSQKYGKQVYAVKGNEVLEFESCRKAAKFFDINHIRMSELCRKPGGGIYQGYHIYYVNQNNDNQRVV